MRALTERLAGANFQIDFGGQLTVDEINARHAELEGLARVGMRYVFVGLETALPEEIGGLSKSLLRRGNSWLERADRAFNWLHDHGFQVGAAVLFGLGESRDSRDLLFRHIEQWRSRLGMPDPVSLNWAVQHPLRGADGGVYRYDDWGTPPGHPLLELFSNHFGEASVRYPMPRVEAPTIAEVVDVVARHRALNRSVTHPT